jgi:ribosomal protein S18 acetylase RimI-like enzyme
MDPAARLAEALTYYRQAGLLPIVRVTPAVEPGFDRLLERLGWQRYNQTSVMMGGLASAASDPDVQITREPDTRWIDALVLTGASPARMVEHRALLARQQAPGFYAWIGSIDAPEAIGMATVSGGLVVLFEIATHPAHRRKGLARCLCRSLLAAGLSAGADHALLQVVADNAAAKSLYQSLGFKELYDYWYRRAPY